MAWPSVKLLAPGSGAFLSASALGAGMGDVVDVWARAAKDVAEAINVAISSFFMMVSIRQAAAFAAMHNQTAS
ncbi:hypothetical protein OCUBac02_15130 [Bosea sp. ANAM02]|nr:hypothetical protein OCUBac02_15130 [Bosea sp. ANAM02]